MPIRGNKNIRYANTTKRIRRQWNAYDKKITGYQIRKAEAMIKIIYYYFATNSNSQLS